MFGIDPSRLLDPNFALGLVLFGVGVGGLAVYILMVILFGTNTELDEDEGARIGEGSMGVYALGFDASKGVSVEDDDGDDAGDALDPRHG